MSSSSILWCKNSKATKGKSRRNQPNHKSHHINSLPSDINYENYLIGTNIEINTTRVQSTKNAKKISKVKCSSGKDRKSLVETSTLCGDDSCRRNNLSISSSYSSSSRSSTSNSSNTKTNKKESPNIECNFYQNEIETEENLDNVNERFLNASNTILGCVVLLRTKSNRTYQGIFVKFSPQFDVLLECCHQIDNQNDVDYDKNLPRKCTMDSKLFKRESIVSMTACDVDVYFALKKTDNHFTDAYIAKKFLLTKKEIYISSHCTSSNYSSSYSSNSSINSSCGIESNTLSYMGKELEPFLFDREMKKHCLNETSEDDEYLGAIESNDENDDDDNDDDDNDDDGINDDEDDDESAVDCGGSSLSRETRGWCAEEMIMVNTTKYGYKSTYNSDLSEYTLPIERENTEAYRKREKEAERLALEIESCSIYRANTEKELSDSEEKVISISSSQFRSSRNYDINE